MDKTEYPDKPIIIHDKNFNKTINRYPLIVVDFWSEWCPPCKIMSPIIEELAKDLQGRVVFGKVDVESNGNMASKFRIVAIPTLLIFNRGKPVKRITGTVPKKHILETLKTYIQ